MTSAAQRKWPGSTGRKMSKRETVFYRSCKLKYQNGIAMKDMTIGSLIQCRSCGSRNLVSEVWTCLEGRESICENGSIQHTVPAQTPRWAIEYALQGISRVTRAWCKECGFEVAVLAGD